MLYSARRTRDQQPCSEQGLPHLYGLINAEGEDVVVCGVQGNLADTAGVTTKLSNLAA